MKHFISMKGRLIYLGIKSDFLMYLCEVVYWLGCGYLQGLFSLLFRKYGKPNSNHALGLSAIHTSYRVEQRDLINLVRFRSPTQSSPSPQIWFLLWLSLFVHGTSFLTVVSIKAQTWVLACIFSFTSSTQAVINSHQSFQVLLPIPSYNFYNYHIHQTLIINPWTAPIIYLTSSFSVSLL